MKPHMPWKWFYNKENRINGQTRNRTTNVFFISNDSISFMAEIASFHKQKGNFITTTAKYWQKIQQTYSFSNLILYRVTIIIK
jgi:hypothetical protein